MSDQHISSAQRLALSLHNDARASLPGSRPALSYSAELDDQAQRWAQTIARSGRANHDPTNNGKTYPLQGENIYLATMYTQLDEEEMIKQACAAWLKKQQDYKKGQTVGDGATWSHWSAMIWPTTTEVGIATATDPSRTRYYVVVRYSPAGNVSGESPLGN